MLPEIEPNQKALIRASFEVSYRSSNVCFNVIIQSAHIGQAAKTRIDLHIQYRSQIVSHND